MRSPARARARSSRFAGDLPNCAEVVRQMGDVGGCALELHESASPAPLRTATRAAAPEPRSGEARNYGINFQGDGDICNDNNIPHSTR
jgi:hypothetical protein